LLDIYPRKVYFFPIPAWSGEEAEKVHNDTIISRESEYVTRLHFAKVEGDVELFYLGIGRIKASMVKPENKSAGD